jgi:hypothetical protein
MGYMSDAHSDAVEVSTPVHMDRAEFGVVCIRSEGSFSGQRPWVLSDSSSKKRSRWLAKGLCPCCLRRSPRTRFRRSHE